jgi:hypothetical protein
MTKKWCIKGTPLYEKQGDEFVKSNSKILVYKVYDVIKNREIFKGKVWSEIRYLDKDKKEKTLWVQDVYLEDLVEKNEQVEEGDKKFPDSEVEISSEIRNPNPSGPAQRIRWEGINNEGKFNLCSEFCVAYIVGESINDFLLKLAVEKNDLYKKYVFKDKATFKPQIKKMLEVYQEKDTVLNLGANIREGIREGLKKLSPEDQVLDLNSIYTPGRMKRILEDYYLIANVGLKGGKLYTKAGGETTFAGHWIVLDKVKPYGINEGWVEVYNPYYNKREGYTFKQFKNFCANAQTGLWVKRIKKSEPKGVEDQITFG